MNLFDLGKKIIKKPWMISLTSKVYSFIFLNHIKGKCGNTINRKGAYLYIVIHFFRQYVMTSSL